MPVKVNTGRMFAFLYLELKNCRQQWDERATLSHFVCLCACVLYSLNYMALMLSSVCRTVEIEGIYADWV